MINVLVKCKILSIETILSTYMLTEHTQAPVYMSILTIQSKNVHSLKTGSKQRLEMDEQNMAARSTVLGK